MYILPTGNLNIDFVFLPKARTIVLRLLTTLIVASDAECLLLHVLCRDFLLFLSIGLLNEDDRDNDPPTLPMKLLRLTSGTIRLLFRVSKSNSSDFLSSGTAKLIRLLTSCLSSSVVLFLTAVFCSSSSGIIPGSMKTIFLISSENVLDSLKLLRLIISWSISISPSANLNRFTSSDFTSRLFLKVSASLRGLKTTESTSSIPVSPS